MGEAASSSNFNYGYPSPGPQNPTPQKVMNHVFFLSDGDWKQVRETERFDFIVVGSGFCALAFIERMLEHHPTKRILVLERGPFFLPEHFQNLPLPYQQTLGGLSETFPWTLSARTAGQAPGGIGWLHGMVPFFGGRSIVWSAWCPRPLDDEMRGWCPHVMAAAKRNFDTAEALLNVVPADKIDSDLEPDALAAAAKRRPIYSLLQRELQKQVADDLGSVASATRSMAAPIAVGAGIQEDIDFAKFSTPAPFLDLTHGDVQAGIDRRVYIATECVVQRILQQENTATALETSQGVVNIGEAKLILAMGTLPPATLLLNSFPSVAQVGARFTAHFITSIVARVPRKDFAFEGELADMELAAIYVAGKSKAGMQYHVQLSALAERDPAANAYRAARYAPDVVATASPQQLASSGDHIVLVCAVLGELDERNADNWLRPSRLGDPTINVTLQVLANSTDRQTWDTMDTATFELIEKVLSPNGATRVEYWHGDPGQGSWTKERPAIEERRVPGLVHEGSTLWIDGDPSKGPVGEDYRPQGIPNVYVTGGALWPTSGSWNPTMTMVALAQDLADKLAGTSSAVAESQIPAPAELSDGGV